MKNKSGSKAKVVKVKPVETKQKKSPSRARKEKLTKHIVKVVEVEGAVEAKKTKVKPVKLLKDEEWRAGMDNAVKAEATEVDEGKFVAEIVEGEKKKKVGLIERIKIFLGLSKKVPEKVETGENAEGVILYGADNFVRAVEIEPPPIPEAVPEEKVKEEVKPPEKKEEDWDTMDTSPAEVGRKLVTGIDKMLFIVKKNDKISIVDIAKTLGVTRKKAEEWAKILEDQELVNIHYPALGEPVLSPATEKKEEENA